MQPNWGKGHAHSQRGGATPGGDRETPAVGSHTLAATPGCGPAARAGEHSPPRTGPQARASSAAAAMRTVTVQGLSRTPALALRFRRRCPAGGGGARTRPAPRALGAGPAAAPPAPRLPRWRVNQTLREIGPLQSLKPFNGGPIYRNTQFRGLKSST